MKAFVYEKYGLPDVLKLKEVEKPSPKDNEVLVKVHASSINDWDWGLLRGTPILNRLISGLLKPKYKVLGSDLAGSIAAVGKNISQFKVGDEVFGDLCEYGWACFAEYVCAPENALVLKPTSITFEEAAAIPQAALLALQSLRDKREIKAGQKVLINGAGGGAGSFAVQIAKLFGTEVTGVDSTGKLDTMRSMGADKVIDYTQEDYTKNGQTYDVIVDMVAKRSVFNYKRALNPGGIFIMVGGSMSSIFQTMLLGPVLSIFGSKKLGILGHKPNKDLAFMKELFESGKVSSLVDRTFPLSELAEAFRYFGDGHAKGKVIITV